jgi:microcystin-dependent protein
MGQAPGLQDYVIGEVGGAEAVSLAQWTVPTHTPSLLAHSDTATAPLGGLTAHGKVTPAHGEPPCRNVGGLDLLRRFTKMP